MLGIAGVRDKRLKVELALASWAGAGVSTWLMTVLAIHHSNHV
jgi:hypothetical protein